MQPTDAELYRWATEESEWTVERDPVRGWHWVRYNIIGPDIHHFTPVHSLNPDLPTVDDALRETLMDERFWADVDDGTEEG